MKAIFSSGLLALMFVYVQADIINVPKHRTNIQGGIDLAGTGDTVLVAEGTYNENISFKGKEITVASHFILDKDTSYISKTIIDGSQPKSPDSGSVVYFVSGEDTSSVLCGFTIIGGTGTSKNDYLLHSEGGGILICESGAQILNNKIINNTTSLYGEGGGIFSIKATIKLKDLIIKNNYAGYFGGGIYCYGSDLTLDSVHISNNSAANSAGIKCCLSNLDLHNVIIQKCWTVNHRDPPPGKGRNAGIHCMSSTLNFSNVKITQNSALTSYGGMAIHHSSVKLSDVTINENSADQYGGLRIGDSSLVVFDSSHRCNIYNNNSNFNYGNDIYCTDSILVVVDTFTVLNPTEYHAHPLDKITFDIRYTCTEIEEGFNLVKDFILFQNYPNPFNPTTVISYQLPALSQIDLSIYNIFGQKVATLVSEKQQAGIYKVEWDASGFASGIYLYNLSTDQGFLQTKKLVVLT